MPDHPLIPVAAGAELYVQETEPAETPAPAPDGDGGIWYPLIELSGGTEQWSYETGGGIQSGVAIADGTAVVGSNDTNVYGLDISDGTEQWSYATGGDVTSGVAIADGTAVVGSFDNNVYGLQQQTEQRYERPRISTGTEWASKF